MHEGRSYIQMHPLESSGLLFPPENGQSGSLLNDYEPPHDKTNKMAVHQSDQSLRCHHEESLGP